MCVFTSARWLAFERKMCLRNSCVRFCRVEVLASSEQCYAATICKEPEFCIAAHFWCPAHFESGLAGHIPTSPKRTARKWRRASIACNMHGPCLFRNRQMPDRAWSFSGAKSSCFLSLQTTRMQQAFSQVKDMFRRDLTCWHSAGESPPVSSTYTVLYGNEGIEPCTRRRHCDVDSCQEAAHHQCSNIHVPHASPSWKAWPDEIYALSCQACGY